MFALNTRYVGLAGTLALGLALAVASAHPTLAQARKPAPAKPAEPSASAPPPAAQQAPQRGAWNAICTSASRQSEVECLMEQTAFLTQTGQLVSKVVIRVPAGTRAPQMVIQVPIGLYLPGGIDVTIDDKKPEHFPLQTCDVHGCYGGGAVSKELLAALEGGTKLSVMFQNTAQEKITVPMTIGNFTDAYNRIK